MSKVAIRRSFCLYIILAVSARALLDVGYVLVVYPVFSHGYERYELIWDVSRYVESWVIFVILVMISPTKIKKPSDFYVLFMLFFLILPILSLYALSDKSRVYMYFVLLSYVVIIVMRRLSLTAFRSEILKEWHVKTICILGMALTAGWMLIARGAQYSLSLEDVYEFRPEASAALDVSFMAYINIWSYKVLGPVVLTLAIIRRSLLLFLFALVFHVLAFAYSQHKSVLFYPVIVVATAWLFSRPRPIIFLPSAIAGISLLALILYERDLIFWVSILYRRTTFLVANITFYYMEYFDSVGYLWWSNNVLSRFLDYPFDLPPAAEVAASVGLNANFNNGFMSTGYMHGGGLGLVIYSVIVGLLLQVMDAMGRKHRSTFLVVAVTLVPMHSLVVSADLLTSLLSHGLGLAVVLLILLRPINQASHAR